LIIIAAEVPKGKKKRSAEKTERLEKLLLCVNRSHVSDEHEQLVGITPLIVIPGNELNELIGKHDACLGVEDGGACIVDEVGGNNVLIGVAEDALELALGSLLHSGADLFVGGGLCEVDGEVNNGNVKSGNTEGHTGELAVELGDYLADSLCGAGGGGDDVACCRSAAAPVLLGGAVNGLLGRGGGVNGGHKTIGDAEVVMNYLSKRSKAVGGAGSVGNNVHIGGILVLVDTHDEHRSISGRSGDNYLLGTCGEVSRSLIGGGENAGGLNNVLSAALCPRDLRGIADVVYSYFLAVYEELAVNDLNSTVESAVDGVILGHVNHVVDVDKGIVDADDLEKFGLIHRSAENKTTDAAKAIDADFDCHSAHSFLCIPRFIVII